VPDIDLRVMKRDLAEQSVPVESAKLTLRAVRADGPFTSVGGSDITTSPTSTVPFRDGAATDRIFLPPTDGTYGWEFELLVDGALLLSEVRGIPTSDDAVPYGSLPKLDRSTLQPTDDAIAAWESTAAGALDARDASVAAAGRADGKARDAASSAGAAAGSAGSAASSAGEAAGSAGSAAGSAGEAAGSAGAAAGSACEASGAAGRASDSATAAAESERKAGLSADAAAGSAGIARTKASEASNSAGQASQAKSAAEQARDLALAGQFNGSAIAASTDLNTITARGVFRQGTGANATLALNYPVAGTGGILEVFSPNASVDYLIQRYTPFGSGNATARGFYLRVRDNGTWAAWRFEATQRINRPAGQPGIEVLPWDDTTSAEVKVMPVNLPLGSANLDLILLDGTYYQDNGANATTANGYPAAATNTAGILRVSRRNHDNWIVQEWNPLSFTATQQSITLIRPRINSTWQAWQIVPTSLTDSSVGRRQFLVDEVNGRLNMVYGDTGRRQFVTADMLNGVTGNWTLRRNGYTVTIEGNPAPQTDIPSGSAVVFGVVPAGFRPTMVNMRQPFRTSSSTVMQGVMIASTTFEISLYAFQNYTVNQGPTPFSLTFQTVDAWPTSLPGAALGVIPVN